MLILSMHSCAVFAADITPERKKKYEKISNLYLRSVRGDRR
jgi:hypothetical protein